MRKPELPSKDDGWKETPKKGKRKRGERCATTEILYYLIGSKLIAVRPWHKDWKPWRCSNRVEKGQKYCINCRRVHQKLADEAEKKL